MQLRLFNWITLMVLAVVYPLATPMGGGDPIGCLGAGLILWASAAWALLPIHPWARASSSPPV